MSKQSIRETIIDAIGQSNADHYPAYVGQAVEALEAREAAINTWVIEQAGEQFGYSRQAAEILAKAPAGAFPEPVEEQDEVTGDATLESIAQSLRSLTSTVGSLVGFAKSHGFRG